MYLKLKSTVNCSEYTIIDKYTNPTIIFSINTSSFANKVFHYFKTSSFSCHMQSSHLMERKMVHKYTRK